MEAFIYIFRVLKFDCDKMKLKYKFLVVTIIIGDKAKILRFLVMRMSDRSDAGNLR